jgi:hypothetical protein
MGPNSPIAPAASTRVPKRVSRSPVSRRIGSNVPKAVVARVTVTNSGTWTQPAACKPRAATKARAKDSNHPLNASRSGRPRTRPRSSSNPAVKNSAARPSFPPIHGNNPEAVARPSTWGPTTMPRIISSTTAGRRRPMGSSASSGAATAMAVTISTGCPL